ncbi:glycine betaine ABC transporter substrate-binding protein [Methanococcoides methylutens]|uniref:Glycine betaine ABC transport system, glycine betaine-binding protein OpuAC n=1 Tax=Methanococcoides methylutens MM1 TaxID=1434104 RepID=A0A0E3X1B7_METMT|nr:glycine betaine ABC transporter substrate-binding protein [Methanococcoides methylutens]AKB85070.1 Glycine betaine ABC transport system, glycine betaine-binding protein OpuAC [Methanococcoides methylutens MM1]
MKNKSIYVLACFMLALAIIGAGCTSSESNENTVEETETIVLGYPPWDDTRANTFVIKQVLESEGYEVETVNADLGAIFQGVAQGDIDVFAGAWLPTTQGTYWERYEDDLDYVNNISTGAKIGLVVPTYVTIDSIDELNENSEKFEGVIQGIEPGAGIMATTEVALEEYDLDYVLSASSTVGMATELQDSIDNEEWMVVTLWQPHWTFARMDLKFLEDPKNIYGEGDNIVLLARNGLSEDKPEAYAILARYEMDMTDIASIMIDLEQGMDQEEAAAKWIENNPEKVNEWLGE